MRRTIVDPRRIINDVGIHSPSKLPFHTMPLQGFMSAEGREIPKTCQNTILRTSMPRVNLTLAS
eukprot:4850449-Pyramimonas_sp.AAC.1